LTILRIETTGNDPTFFKRYREAGTSRWITRNQMGCHAED
jgi:hypothetical protein